MFNISSDIDYINIYRDHQHLPLLEEDDAIITKGLERACNLFSDFGFKATFFVVGDSVKRYKSYYLKLMNDGHELGNHTMHHANLFQLPEEKQKEEICDCQKIIKDELGYESVGFKAPCYNIPEQVYPMLSQSGIKYDTSSFNNILVPLAKAIFYVFTGKRSFGKIDQMFQTARIHKKGGLFIVPVGTTILKLPFYGSLHAMYPILSILKPPNFAFTYLVHPLEFLENSEMCGVKIGFRTTLNERMRIYRKIFNRLKKAQRRCLLLKDMIMELEHGNR